MLFLQALTLMLIGLKLTGHIAWPWVAVFTPLLIWALLVAYAAYAQQRRQEYAQNLLMHLLNGRGNDDNDDQR